MDVFTLKGTGEEEVFMPSFAYHGFSMWRSKVRLP